jgi:type III secretion protein R
MERRIMNPGSIDPVTLMLLLAAMSLAPLILMCTTCFLKVSIVLVIVRNAIGVQQVPPSMAVYGLALTVTMFVMAPVFQQVAAALPQQGTAAAVSQVGAEQLKAAAEPLRRFMVANTPPPRRAQFRDIAVRQWPPQMAASVSDTDFVVVVPAFVVSELQLAFEVGFVLYVPFVVIDLLVSNLLLALGMQMVSPMVISLPLKLLLFVMLDGWAKLIEGLARSYA